MIHIASIARSLSFLYLLLVFSINNLVREHVPWSCMCANTALFTLLLALLGLEAN